MFSLVHKKTTNGNHQVKKPSMIFEFKNSMPFRVFQPPTPTAAPVVVEDSQPKMKWGRPIWTFFHVTAEKIKPEFFDIVVREYLNYIRDPRNGFRSALLSLNEGTEFSVRLNAEQGAPAEGLSPAADR